MGFSSILIIIKLVITFRKLKKMSLAAKKEMINEDESTIKAIPISTGVVSSLYKLKIDSSIKSSAIGDINNRAINKSEENIKIDIVNNEHSLNRIMKYVNRESSNCIQTSDVIRKAIDDSNGDGSRSTNQNDTSTSGSKAGVYEQQLLDDVDLHLNGTKSKIINKGAFHNLTGSNTKLIKTRITSTHTNDKDNLLLDKKESLNDISEKIVGIEKSINSRNNINLVDTTESNNLNKPILAQQPVKKLKSILRRGAKKCISGVASSEKSTRKLRVRFDLPPISEEEALNKENKNFSSSDEFAISRDPIYPMGYRKSIKYKNINHVPRILRRNITTSDEDNDDIVFCDDWTTYKHIHSSDSTANDVKVTIRGVQCMDDDSETNSLQDTDECDKCIDINTNHPLTVNSNCIDRYRMLQITKDMNKSLIGKTTSKPAHKSDSKESSTNNLVLNEPMPCVNIYQCEVKYNNAYKHSSQLNKIDKDINITSGCGDSLGRGGFNNHTGLLKSDNNTGKTENNTSEPTVHDSRNLDDAHINTSIKELLVNSDDIKTQLIKYPLLTCDVSLSSLEDIATSAFSNIIDQVRDENTTPACTVNNNDSGLPNKFHDKKSEKITSCKPFVSKNYKNTPIEPELITTTKNEITSANIEDKLKNNQDIQVLPSNIHPKQDSEFSMKPENHSKTLNINKVTGIYNTLVIMKKENDIKSAKIEEELKKDSINQNNEVLYNYKCPTQDIEFKMKSEKYSNSLEVNKKVGSVYNKLIITKKENEIAQVNICKENITKDSINHEIEELYSNICQKQDNEFKTKSKNHSIELEINKMFESVYNQLNRNKNIKYVFRDKTSSHVSEYTYQLISEKDDTFEGVSEFSDYIPDKKM